MIKHVLDRPKIVSNAMLQRAIIIKKKAMPKRASLTLQRRVREARPSLRAAQFLRIERQGLS